MTEHTVLMPAARRVHGSMCRACVSCRDMTSGSLGRVWGSHGD